MQGISKLKKSQDERLKNIKKASEEEKEQDKKELETYKQLNEIEREQIKLLEKKRDLLVPLAKKALIEGKLEAAVLYEEAINIATIIAYKKTVIEYREIQDLDERRKYAAKLMTEFEMQTSMSSMMDEMSKSLTSSGFLDNLKEGKSNEGPIFSRRKKGVEKELKVELKAERKDGKAIFSVQVDTEDEKELLEAEEIKDEVEEEAKEDIEDKDIQEDDEKKEKKSKKREEKKKKGLKKEK